MMLKTKYCLLIFFACLLIFFTCQQALALEVGLQYGGATQDVRVTIAQIVRTVMGILGILAIILVIIGGVYFMTSRGDPEQEAKAKKILISALVGLVIVLSAYFLASFILNTLIESTGEGQPGGDENGGGAGDPQPITSSCIGSTPANATFCPEPNATGLSIDTQRELVPNCSGDLTKCEYICPMDYNIFEGNCVNGDPYLSSLNYQAFYSFTTGANALPTSLSGLFDGIAYRYSGGTSSPDPTAISNGVLNLDGSHYVRVNNFSIGPSFTAVARAKSNTDVWNTYGWIISTQSANGFLIHPNAATNSWTGYIYDVTGSRSSYILVGTYTPTDAQISDWHTYGLQYDNEHKIAKMIFDGQVVISRPIDINRGTANQNITIDIGHDLFSGTTRYGKGKIDWVYIYNLTIY